MTEDPGFAPAKVNLALHVLGRRPDGYHDLESLIAFAAVGDRVALQVSDIDRLAVTGPFAGALDAACAAEHNLAMRAAAAFRAAFGGRAHHVSLEKNLPLAAGIGGGSADAAAVLRLLATAANLSIGDPRLQGVARSLGADVPACLLGQPCCVAGTGDRIAPLDRFPTVAIVLVNAGGAVPTAPVFARWSAGTDGRPRPLSGRFLETAADAEGLAAALADTRNMLQRAAIAIAPEVGSVLAALETTPGCLLARMSGSGGTCFGLFTDSEGAAAGARRIASAHTDWWVRATCLEGATGT